MGVNNTTAQSIWVYNHSCFNELITAILPIEQYRSVHILLDL